MPSHLVYQWAEEIVQITNKFRVYLYFGTEKRTQNGTPGRLFNVIEGGELDRGHDVFTGPNPGHNIILTSLETWTKRHGKGAHDRQYADVETGMLDPIPDLSSQLEDLLDRDHDTADERKTGVAAGSVTDGGSAQASTPNRTSSEKSTRTQSKKSKKLVKSRDPPSPDKAKARRKNRRQFDPNPTWSRNLVGHFQVVVVDEAHKLKNQSTQAFTAIRQLKAQFHVLLTATPMLSDVTDFKALLELVVTKEMNQAWNELSAEEKDSNLFLDQEHRQAYIQNPPDVLFAPEAQEQWLWKADQLKGANRIGLLTAMAPLLATCLTKRTLASKVDGNSIGELVPPTVSQDVRCAFSPKEMEIYARRLAHLVQHNRNPNPEEDYPDQSNINLDFGSLRKVHLLGGWLGAYDIAFSLNAGKGKLHQRALNRHGHLGILLASEYLKAVHAETSHKLSLATGRYRKTKFRQVIKSLKPFTGKTGVRKVTREQALVTLLNGAPIMREMLKRLLTQVCILGERAIIWTVNPGQQWFVTAVLNLVGISVAAVHAEMSPTERREVVNDFNTRNRGPRVLVLQYVISAEGTNLQHDCRNVHFFDFPPSITTLLQAIGRLRRFRQKWIVKVFYYHLSNSFQLELFMRSIRRSSQTAFFDWQKVNATLEDTGSFNIGYILKNEDGSISQIPQAVAKQVKTLTPMDFYMAARLRMNDTQRLFRPPSNVPDRLKTWVATFPAGTSYADVRDWPADDLQSFIRTYPIPRSDLDDDDDELMQENPEDSEDEDKDMSGLEDRSDPDSEDLEDEDEEMEDLEKPEESEEETSSEESEEE